jgi:CubicO group peptidase (beta-lactamase class C family)
MKPLGSSFLALVLLAATMLPVGPARGQTMSDLDGVRQQILAEMAGNTVPDLAVAAVKDGRILFVEAYSSGGADSISAQTPFRIASLSKAFTAVAVLQLVEQGRIELDAPVRTYLPAFTTADPAGAAQITVRQLLNQTSGLADPGFPEMRLTQPHTLAERVETLRDARPVAPPGREFHYFNPNYAILARLVEVVSGRDCDAYLTQHVLAPLGMTRTFAAATGSEMERRAPNLAQGHVGLFGFALPWREGQGFLGGSGGVVSTAEDMARWLAMLANRGELDGVRVLSPESIQRMEMPPRGSTYGMGWLRTTVEGRPALFHNGILSTVYTEATLFPEERSGIVLLANVNSVPHALLAFPRLRGVLLRAATAASTATDGFTVRAFGLGAAAATVLMAAACLFDFSRTRSWVSWAQRAARWKVGSSLGLRLVPLAVLITLPEIIQVTTGRAFSLRATALAMLDIAVPLAMIGSILGAGALLRALRLSIRARELQ